MESLGYLWVYLLKGRLPWQGLQVKSRDEKYESIKKLKQELSLEEVCEGLPGEFLRYMQHCKSLKFEEEPDYKGMKMMFRDLFFKLDLNWDFVFEWNKEVRVGESDR